MIKRHNNISLVLGVLGIFLQIIGNIIAQTNPETGASLWGGLIMLTGTILLIAGLSHYALAKGRSGWWGLCGFLSIIGLIILALLKDHTPDA